MRPTYDEIGTAYAGLRRPDPRIAAQIVEALGDATSILDVGAGTGSYEPPGNHVVAVEHSTVMIRQRPNGSAPAAQGTAEHLPFRDNTFDAAMALLTVHHWRDTKRGLLELRRVARRTVILTFDRNVHNSFWLIREYLPAAGRLTSSQPPAVEEIAAAVGAHRVDTVPVPHDCVDGFGWAYWRRPERYLDPVARGAISMLATLGPADLDPGLERLAADLASGRWHERHAGLLDLDSIDGGFRLIIG